MILNRQEKEQLVIKLAGEKKTTKKIAQIAHVSLTDLGKIIRKYIGEESEYQNKSPSITSRAFQMFKDNKRRVNVTIALNLESDDLIGLYEDYFQLLNLDKLFTIHKELGNEIYLLDHLLFQLKQEDITTKDRISRFTEMAGRLTRLDEDELKICEQIGRLNSKKFELEREIEEAIKELNHL